MNAWSACAPGERAPRRVAQAGLHVSAVSAMARLFGIATEAIDT